MNWFIENLQILATLGSALVVYMALRRGAKKDTEELKKKVELIETQTIQINLRLIRLEGGFEERGNRDVILELFKRGTEEKK